MILANKINYLLIVFSLLKSPKVYNKIHFVKLIKIKLGNRFDKRDSINILL